MLTHDEYSEEIPRDDESSVIRKRQNQVKLYLSDSELARFKDLQRETSLSGASLVRRWITGQPVKSTIDIQAVNEMRRQGGLCKHIAHSLSNRGIVSDDVAERLLTLAASIHSIARGIRDDIEKSSKD